MRGVGEGRDGANQGCQGIVSSRGSVLRMALGGSNMPLFSDPEELFETEKEGRRYVAGDTSW